jgi:hypothetical protein
MPPVPITARVRISLGGVWPGPPRTCLGTMATVAIAAMELRRKLRRVSGLWEFMIESAMRDVESTN